ncbi:MAG: TetR/AcrR family transcriptional regulator [Pseudomonadota bacterium]
MKRALSEEAKDERRLVILEAALDEFFERGFAAARTDDIASRAGVSKGTLYLYFDSKDAIFKAIVDAFAIQNLERFEELAEQNESGFETIAAILRQAPRHLRESYFPRIMKILIADSKTFPDTVNAYREQVIDRLLRILSSVLIRANKKGEISVSDPDLVARLVIAPIALSSLWNVLFADGDDTPPDIEKLIEAHIEFLRSGLNFTGELQKNNDAGELTK